METKICKKCGQELPVENFSKNSRTKDGLQGHCKKCALEYAKASYAKRKERRKENERIEFEKKYKIYTNQDLAKFTPRELMLELKARGYVGTLLYEEVIVNKHFIDLSKYE
jgi:hypothetical protein